MGEVRSTIQDVKPGGGKSPLVTLATTKEQLYDLLQTKKRDLEAEGEGQRKRNEGSIATLQAAIAAVKAAEIALESY